MRTPEDRAQWKLLNDIDHTMINSSSMAQMALESVAKYLSISCAQVIQCRDQYIASLGPRGSVKFNPVGFINYLVAHLEPNLESQNRKALVGKTLNVYLRREHFATALYADVIPVLQDLRKCMVLGTFSEGVYLWQFYKLQCTRLLEFFKNTEYRNILPDKRTQAVLDDIPPFSIIADDNLVVIALLLSAQQQGRHIYPVLVNRLGQVVPEELLFVPQITTYEQLPDVVMQFQRLVGSK